MRDTHKYAWDVLNTPLHFKEITAPTAAQISADTLALYAKDRTGISSLYFKDDAGVEHDLGAITTPQALTRVNDTNVTVTLGGTPATALLQAVSLTLGWTGTLGLARGGTNANLSATGGAGQVLKQTTLGGNVTVATLAASEIASGAALSKVDDTNVTLTLGGAPTLALLQATSLTLGWTGTLGVARGGTNIASYAVGDILYASATTTLSKLADVAAGSYLRSGGVTTAPLWSTLILPNAATANRIVYASSTNTYGESANLAYDGTDFLLGSGTRARMSGQNRIRFLNSMVSATRNTDQTITSSTWTLVTWNSENYDTDTLHDNSTNPSRCIAAIAGKYLVASSCTFSDLAAGDVMQTVMRINAAGSFGSGTVAASSPPTVQQSGFGISATCFSLISLAANDYIETFVFQTNAASKTLNASSSPFQLMVYLGE